MSNIDTVKAITTNLEGVLTGLGWKLEDLSSDPDVDTTPVCQVLYEGESFEDLYGERPQYNTIAFLVRVVRNRTQPGTSRDAQQEAVHAIRGAVTVAALNAGSLATSKLVNRVAHTGAQVEYDPPLSILDYRLQVRYRET